MIASRADIEVNRYRWHNTSFLRADGKTEYREKSGYGNRHAVFENGSSVGDMHVDRFNATDFPMGTIRHASNYVEEKTGIPEPLVTGATIFASAYIVSKIAQWANRNL